jgi:hypothetical protein
MYAARNAMGFALAHFNYVPDLVQHKMIEHWPSFAEIAAAIGDGSGILSDDCDGWARLCQWWLKTTCTLDSAVLYCQTETGGYHLVCEVGGSPEVSGFVLDNRQEEVTTRADLAERGYKFLEYAKDSEWTELSQAGG